MEQQGSPKVGINVSFSERAGDRVLNAIVDAFSPISESLGLLGDKIRVYRANSAIRTIERAKEIADEEGRPLELPHPKFFVPFIEAASLEDEDDDGLREKWAKLLSRAGQDPDSISYFARTVLSEISSAEAKLLDFLVQKGNALGCRDDEEYFAAIRRELDALHRAVESTVKQLESGAILGTQARHLMSEAVQRATRLHVPEWRFQTKSTAFPREMTISNSELGTVRFTADGFNKRYHHYQILESRNVISVSQSFNGPENFSGPLVWVTYYTLTTLGLGLARKLY